MRKKSISFDVHVFRNIDELPEYQGDLLLHAIEGLSKSYAPYSNFHVSAAILLQNDVIISGANFENAAYPECLCAERVALAAAASQYPNVRIKEIAVTAMNPVKKLMAPIPPCGACRQVLCEVENKYQNNIRVILGGSDGPVHVIDSASFLLPFTFSGDFL